LGFDGGAAGGFVGGDGAVVLEPAGFDEPGARRDDRIALATSSTCCPPLPLMTTSPPQVNVSSSRPM
jgi:hypothetical protein